MDAVRGTKYCTTRHDRARQGGRAVSRLLYLAQWTGEMAKSASRNGVPTKQNGTATPLDSRAPVTARNEKLIFTYWIAPSWLPIPPIPSLLLLLLLSQCPAYLILAPCNSLVAPSFHVWSCTTSRKKCAPSPSASSTKRSAEYHPNTVSRHHQHPSLPDVQSSSFIIGGSPSTVVAAPPAPPSRPRTARRPDHDLPQTYRVRCATRGQLCYTSWPLADCDPEDNATTKQEARHS